MKLIILLWIAAAVVLATPPKSCMQFVEKIMTKKIGQDLAEILPFVMYSGIASNNPGQMHECQKTKTNQTSYNYFLINWKNSTNNIESFTGLCVPDVCNKTQIEKALQLLSIKNSRVYDYPASPPADPIFIVSTVFVGIWVLILITWSIVLSCRAPVENELIKKNQEHASPNEGERPINSLLSSREAEIKQDFKLFNFYEGYCRIFKRSNKKNILGPIFFLAIFSLMLSFEFSSRQTVSANQMKSLKWFNSLAGVLFCNVQIAFSVIVFILGVKLAYSLFKLNSFHEIGRFFFDQLLTKWATLVLVSMAAYFIISLTDEPLNQLFKTNAVADCPSTIYQVWFVFRGLQFDGKVCLPWFWVLEADIFLTLLAAPFYIIYKTNKSLGYALFSLIIITSIFVGFLVLDNQGFLFEPYKLFNMAREFTINYQASTIIRMSPYFIGFLFGLLINQGIEKDTHEERDNEHALAKIIRRNHNLQVVLHLGGLGIMVAMYLLIIPYLPLAGAGETREKAYAYIVFAPFGFLCGLMMFLIPCFWQGESKLTVVINKVLNGVWSSSLDKLTVGFLTLGPVVIGFTTFSMQNSIFFDFQTVFIYLLGDLIVIYIVSTLVVSAIVHQLQFLSKWVQSKVFADSTSKYSVLILED